MGVSGHFLLLLFPTDAFVGSVFYNSFHIYGSVALSGFPDVSGDAGYVLPLLRFNTVRVTQQFCVAFNKSSFRMDWFEGL